MSNPKLTYEKAKEAIDAVNRCIKEGYKFRGVPSAVYEAARRLGTGPQAMWSRVRSAETFHGLVPDTSPTPVFEPELGSAEEGLGTVIKPNLAETVKDLLKQGKSKTLAELVGKTCSDTAQVLDALDELKLRGVNIHRYGDRFEIPRFVQAAYLGTSVLELKSDANNKYLIGCVGDNHCGSKYERRDVLNDLYDRFYEAGVKTVLHSGNWIDGDARFNRHDLVAHGLEQQCQLLAETYPQREGVTTYAVWGDDHEGWYAQREGIDAGSYCEGVMRRAGRKDWVNLGFMEAAVPLVNYNSGSSAVLALVHPGGGSSYALSYAIQKIVESLEGGEKPAVGIYGHLHKLWAGNIRNVWCLITGCTQDQTPFMRKNKLEAHVAGTIVTMTQDPESGAITGFCPDMMRYFVRDYYSGRWSHHGKVVQPERSVGGL